MEMSKIIDLFIEKKYLAIGAKDHLIAKLVSCFEIYKRKKIDHQATFEIKRDGESACFIIKLNWFIKFMSWIQDFSIKPANNLRRIFAQERESI